MKFGSSIVNASSSGHSATVAKGRVQLAGYLWGMAAVLIWSGSFVLIRLGVKTSMNAFDITALRFGFAAVLLLPVIWRQGFAIEKLGFLGLAVLISGTGAPYVLLIAQGLKYAPASHAAALVPGLMSLLATILGSLILRESMPPRWPYAAVAIFTGVGILITRCFGAIPETDQSFGQVLFGIAAVLWSTYTVVLRKYRISSWHATAIVAVGSAILYLPLYATLLPRQIDHATWGEIFLQSIYQGGLTTVLGLIAFNQAINLLGAARGAALPALIPVVTLVLAPVISGESPGLLDVMAGLVIAAGVLLMTVFSIIKTKDGIS